MESNLVPRIEIGPETSPRVVALPRKAHRLYPKWTPARRRKFRATMRRKRQEASQVRKGGTSRKPARKAVPGARTPSRRGFPGRSGNALGRDTAAYTGLSRKPSREERLDAIVYLQAAVGHYAIPDSDLLALLALRSLQGRIK